MARLELADINTFYGESHVLQGVSLSVDDGEVVSLLGRNGAGKTTTLRTIMGYLQPRPGRITYGGRDLVGPREFRIASELGYKTAVTTRPGVLFAAHDRHMTALPRLSLNGEYQAARYVKVLMSGAATALFNGFRRVDAA